MADATTTEPATVQSLAKEAAKHFERVKRRPDDEEYIHVQKTGAPEWVNDLCQEAHGDMFPDDLRYSFIVEVLDALADADDLDTARDELEPDVYTHDLTGWLHSRNDRQSYVDDARSEYGNEGTLSDDLARGQLMEKYEVFDAVRSFLDERADELAE